MNQIEDLLKQHGLNINERGELVPQSSKTTIAVSASEDKPLIGGLGKTLLILGILVGTFFFLGMFPLLVALVVLLISHL